MKTEPQDRSTVVLGALLGAIVLALTILGAAALGAQGAPVSGAFVLRSRGDTLAIERFTRSRDTLQGSLAGRGTPTQTYVAALGPGPSIRSVALALFAPGAKADDAPMQKVRLTFEGDSATLDAGGSTRRIGMTANAIPWLNNSFALFELFTERARKAGGTLETPLFALVGGATIPVSFKPLGADTLLATLSGQELRLRVDAAGRILGGVNVAQQLDLLRASGAAAATISLGRPDYSAPAGAPYTAEEVTLKGPGGITLGGTLTLPKDRSGPVAAIVTITGSGQEDRDEYIPVAGGYRPFRQVADTLGRRGIAVLRLDDRMVGLSGGALGTSADYADDIRAGITFLRTRPEIDGKRIGLVGHSEGGIIAPMVAATDASLRGIVILAGPSLTGDSIIKYQLRNGVNRDPSIPAAKRDSAYRALRASFDAPGPGAVWTKYFLAYDPLPTAKRVKVPTLILQGQTDQQVTPEQAEQLGAAIRSGGNRDVTVRVMPELNHLFIHDPDGNPAGYVRLPTNKMSAEVLGLLADWLVLKLAAGTSP